MLKQKKDSKQCSVVEQLLRKAITEDAISRHGVKRYVTNQFKHFILQRLISVTEHVRGKYYKYEVLLVDRTVLAVIEFIVTIHKI